MISKAAEKELLASIVRNLPQGYVRDILAGMQLEIESAIDSDFGFVNFRLRMEQQREMDLEMEAKRKTISSLKEQITQLEFRKGALIQGLDSLGSTVRKLSQLI